MSLLCSAPRPLPDERVPRPWQVGPPRQGVRLPSLREAALLYARSLPRRTHHQPLLPVLLRAAASLAELGLGRPLHAEAVKSAFARDLLVGATLVSMYCKGGAIADARRAFEEMPERNVVMCNALLAGYAAAGDMDGALALFGGMPSWTSVTCATTLIQGFAEKGDMAGSRRWFEATPPGLRTVVTWTVVVHGYVIAGDMETAIELLDKMPARNAFVWSSMVTGYFKAGDAEEARAVFDKIPARNLVNWNALVAGYAQIGFSEKALEALHSMLEERVKPDEFTMTSVLSACAQLRSLEQVKKVHEFVNRKHIRKNHFVMNALVDMYAKCGNLEYARYIFDSMRWRNSEIWKNSMISALASHGQSDEALQLFQMEGSEQKHNAITLLAVLGACTHGGFVDEGLSIFKKFRVYGVEAGVEHYGSLVDLLGRAGKLKEAYEIVENMPEEPNEVIWGALLGACRVHGDAAMSRWVSEEIRELHSGRALCNDADRLRHTVKYHGCFGEVGAGEYMRRKMARHGIEKTPGCSSLDIPECQAYAGSRQ